MKNVIIEVVTPVPIASFALGAAAHGPVIDIPEAQIDVSFAPIPMRASASPSLSLAFAGSALAPSETWLVRATVDEKQISAIEQNPEVVGVWSDPEIGPFIDVKMNPVVFAPPPLAAVDCNANVASGSSQQVAELLGARRVWGDGYRGQRITVGVVDGGVDGGLFPVDGGWSPPGQTQPGDPAVAWGGHGNMCAFDVRVAAPESRFFDYCIGKTPGGVVALLSSALQSFHHALENYRAFGTPHVLTNSWGLYQQAWDPFPPGDARNYTHNPNHPFTRKVIEAIDAGLLVTFAAGNCGLPCADGRCGLDVGPGKSIRGANGHERVICVGGVNLRRERVGYSSQGPSTLFNQKPDVSGYTHFQGFTSCDNGTSAACPVVAGVLALLRSAFPDLRQDRARSILMRTAANLGPPGWNPDTGMGVVNAAASYDQLRHYPSSPR